MSPFKDVINDCSMAFQLIGLLLLIAQTYVAVDAFYDRRRIAYRVFCIVQLALGLFLFCALMDGTFTVSYSLRKRTYPFLVDVLYSLPWAVIAAAEILLAAAAAACIVGAVQFRRTHLSGGSVKETVDMLPVGVCFSKTDGTVVLKNLRMERLCAALTGNSLNDASDFFDRLCSLGAESGDTLLVTAPDGEIVRFARERLTLDGAAYDLLVASDITEQYQITLTLKGNRKKLLDIRMRMRAFGEETSRLAMSEEILKARTTVHDEVGHILLICRFYLENPGETDEKKLLALAKRTNKLLTREGEQADDAKRDSFTEALDVARAIGVSVSVCGELPADDRLREILAHAVRECSANVVKHAGGDRLSLKISAEDGCLTAVLRGNGEPPAGSVTETGGLLLLRRRVESEGGWMRLSADPCLAVMVMVPIS